MDDHSQETPSSDATVLLVEFACPECRSDLVVTGNELRCGSSHHFVVEQGVYHLLPASVSPLALEDAHYHGAQKESWIEQSQVDTYRNTYFHRSVLGAIAAKARASADSRSGMSGPPLRRRIPLFRAPVIPPLPDARSAFPHLPSPGRPRRRGVLQHDCRRTTTGRVHKDETSTRNAFRRFESQSRAAQNVRRPPRRNAPRGAPGASPSGARRRYGVDRFIWPPE